MKKKLIKALAGTLMLLAMTTVIAQPPKRTPPTKSEVKERAQKLATELSLTEEQTASFVNIELDFFEKMEANRENRAGRESMKALMDEKNLEVKSLLTESQFTQYEAKLAERRENMADRRKP